MSGGEDRAAIERAKLSEAMAVTAAEGLVTSARMADLIEAQCVARAQHSAAKGLLTKAMTDGSAEKDRNGAGPRGSRLPGGRPHRQGGHRGDARTQQRRTGQPRPDVDQMGRAWEADAAAIHGPDKPQDGREAEAGR